MGAEEALRGALAVSPSDWRYLSGLGQLFHERSRPKDAIPWYQQAMDSLKTSGQPRQAPLERDTAWYDVNDVVDHVAIILEVGIGPGAHGGVRAPAVRAAGARGELDGRPLFAALGRGLPPARLRLGGRRLLLG